jgi:transcriptional regulator with XRE-family HTH domain
MVRTVLYFLLLAPTVGDVSQSHPNQDPKRLRRKRIEAGLTQTALAQMAGVTKSHVSAVEKGNAGFSPQNIAAIATALGCEISELLPDDDEEDVA